MGKILLPVFGGSYSVWVICLLFFQFVLLLGYGFSYYIDKKWSFKKQKLALILLVAFSLIQLLLFYFNNFSVTYFKSLPTLQVLFQLSLSIGISYFTLSALSPTLQRWLGGKNPYRLYFFSNLGSLLALLSYPFIMEHFFNLSQQKWIFFIFFLLMSLCLFLIFKMQLNVERVEIAQQKISTVTGSNKGLWFLYSMGATTLMMAVTNHLSFVLLPLPLLWVFPLAIYLLSFALAFIERNLLPNSILNSLVFLSLPVLAIFIIGNVVEPVALVLALHLLALFILNYYSLRRLYSLRPSNHALTQFYLWIAFGGVCAGLLVSIIAPLIFNGIYEYPLALLLVSLTLIFDNKNEKESYSRLWWLLPLVSLAFVFIPFKKEFLILYFPLLFLLKNKAKIFIFSWLIGFVIFHFKMESESESLYRGRSFYGSFQVLNKKQPQRHIFVHGQTLHGVERQEQRDIPLGYYHSRSPMAEIFNNFGKEIKDVAVIGLGIGSMACYSQPEQNWLFFEIDRKIVELATQSDYFQTFQKCMKGSGQVRVGDGRLLLKKEKKQSLDLIIIDAFNSDSVPLHLLTKEAMELYLQRLRPQGFLLFHISNRFLNLAPVIANLAVNFHRRADFRDVQGDESEDFFASEWVLVLPEEDVRREALNGWQVLETTASPLWTDQYSSVLRYFK